MHKGGFIVHAPKKRPEKRPSRTGYNSPIRSLRRSPRSSLPMSGLLLVLPDFLVILLGVLLRARFFSDSAFWMRTEKLVFYVLLPAMLFLSVAGSTVALGDAAIFLSAGVLSMSLAAALAWGIRYVVRADDVTHASVFQCGFRFNSYIGFALAARIGGDEALALLALLIAVWVPISNALATAEIARAVAKADGVEGAEGAAKGVAKSGEKHGKGGAQPGTMLTGRALLRKTLRGVVTNPLILATVGGLLWKALGLPLPATLVQTFKHLGDASLALGLLCIGAGLTAGALRKYARLIAAATFERLVAAPVAALLVTSAVALFFPLPPMGAAVVLLFAALPTAQSCYVMASAMGGNAPAVAGVTTAHILASAVTLPLWTVVIQRVLAGAGLF